MILQRPGHHAQQAYWSILGLRFRQNMYAPFRKKIRIM